MSRPLAAAIVTAALFAAAPVGSALADAGAPGSTFPEQPGTNPSTGCVRVGANSGTGVTNESPTARTITSAIYSDACLEPPST